MFGPLFPQRAFSFALRRFSKAFVSGLLQVVPQPLPLGIRQFAWFPVGVLPVPIGVERALFDLAAFHLTAAAARTVKTLGANRLHWRKRFCSSIFFLSFKFHFNYVPALQAGRAVQPVPAVLRAGPQVRVPLRTVPQHVRGVSQHFPGFLINDVATSGALRRRQAMTATDDLHLETEHGVNFSPRHSIAHRMQTVEVEALVFEDIGHDKFVLGHSAVKIPKRPDAADVCAFQ